MKGFCLLLMAALSTSLFAETVVKLGASFKFPTTVGVIGNSVMKNEESFACKTYSTGRGIVEFSWSLPGRVQTGSISVFSLSGGLVKTFTLAYPKGSVRWDISIGKRPAKGTYIAMLSYGQNKHNLKMVLY